MKIRMLEEIKRPFLATKGEVRDVHDSVAIDLTAHGFAEFAIGEETDASNEDGKSEEGTADAGADTKSAPAKKSRKK